ncbi:complex I subunit 5 family protein [Streptosporangium amethystogenes]|uniref:complex I subunit 5 family protein n=1 Tax=Streptosporangium amethystogenes TaxID=2002 RepID=UPI003797EB69
MPSGPAVTSLAPLAIAVPVVVACMALLLGRYAPRPAVDLLSISGAAAVTALTALLLWTTAGGRVVTWVGGWWPRQGRSVGIVLVADPVGAGLACLASALTCCALLYSWRYLDSAEGHYHALVSLFLAGMVGFALSGDIFNMFVFFELMGVAAYALTGVRIEEPDSLQGSLNFAVINSLGAYLTLMGIGLLYARTGELGLAQLGAALGDRRADALILTAFVLVVTGFLVKAAMAPVHFWLADAHAVAPSPVCALMSGVMVELGVYAVARVYVTVFSESLGDRAVRPALLVFGLLTALVGTLMCVIQRHLKRLLAYSTIAHVGLFLLGLAPLSTDALAGVVLYVAGHAGVKAALFLVAGLLIDRYRSVDEGELFGRCGHRNIACWLFLLAAVTLAGLPPFGPGLGKAVTEDAALSAGHPWLPVVFVVVSAVTGGAVLRAGLRIFLGLGHRPHPLAPAVETGGENEEPETPGPLPRTPVTMLVATGALLAVGAAVGLVPALATGAGHAARLFADRDGYLAQALYGAPARALPEPRVAGWSGLGLLLGTVSVLLAVAVAATALYAGPALARSRPGRLVGVLVPLRGLHSGHIGDYVAWLFFGMAVLALVVAVSVG